MLLFAVIFAATLFQTSLAYTKCYGDLGCYSSHDIVPVPEEPATIATTFKLFSRQIVTSESIHALNFRHHLAAWARFFDHGKDTKVLIHGFLDKGDAAWLQKAKTELLKRGNFNVIVVDWGHGSGLPYELATANTAIVATQLANFLQFLRAFHGLDFSKLHIIGHSLGAQIAGFTGHSLQHVARITGLDPADPHFTGRPTDQRLDATDARLVDVIHTDAAMFTVVAGYGTRDAVGDIDFYPNGGQDQPGCAEKHITDSLGNIVHLAFSDAANSFKCSHGRSRELFIESINSQCHFYGHKCPTADGFENGTCLGCPAGGCPMMGYDADKTSARGTFYLSTSGKAPYCGHEYFVTITLSDIMPDTYGEFFIVLVGAKGESEPLKFESKMHMYHQSQQESHVIVTHVDIGTVTSLKLQYVRATWHSLLRAHHIVVHSVVVQPTETSNKTIFCANDYSIHSGDKITITSTKGC